MHSITFSSPSQRHHSLAYDSNKDVTCDWTKHLILHHPSGEKEKEKVKQEQVCHHINRWRVWSALTWTDVYPSTFLHSLVPWFTGGVALAPSSHSQHLCLGHSAHMLGCLLAHALQQPPPPWHKHSCIALHCIPYDTFYWHAWMGACVQVFVMPWWVEEIEQVCFTMPGSGSGRPASFQNACCCHAPTDSPFVPPCPKPSGCWVPHCRARNRNRFKLHTLPAGAPPFYNNGKQWLTRWGQALSFHPCSAGHSEL